MLVRRVDHVTTRSATPSSTTGSSPGELLDEPPRGVGRRLGSAPTRTRSRPQTVDTEERRWRPSPRRSSTRSPTSASRTVWGVVGDALNPVTDAIRREERIEWIGVRHEEVGAFAAGAQAQLDRHARRLHGHRRPRLDPPAQRPLRREEVARPGAGDLRPGAARRAGHATSSRRSTTTPLFRDVAEFCRTITSPAQLPRLLEQAVQRALDGAGRRGADRSPATSARLRRARRAAARIARSQIRRRARRPAPRRRRPQLIDAARHGDDAGRHRRPRTRATEVLALADRLSAPMVLTLKAKEGLERDNPYRGRPERADRQPGRPARRSTAATCC